MSKQMVRVVAAIVDIRNLTLYTQEGKSILIPQGDPRVRRIVSEITTPLEAQGWAEVDIAPYTEEHTNAYADFEEKSQGIVKFFRVAKKHLKKLFTQENAEEVCPPMAIGHVPDAAAINTMKEAVDEVMKHAVPVSAASFHEEGLDTQACITDSKGNTPKEHTPDTAEDTIVAMVGGKVIPGVEKIRNQFKHASALSSTEGVENFLKRLGSIIDKRSHSVEDLLKFMERGDLPIADDGSILVYKVLNLIEPGRYKDCHTGKVPQWVGAYVCMDPSLVDSRRDNECSNGLHIARRGYVSSFGGSVCVLAKVAPEDVITVPTYDANKMRACGYHIIAELTPEQYKLLNQNKPITLDDAGAKLLAAAIKGLHPARTHEIRITDHKGGGIVTTELLKPPKNEPKPDLEAISPAAALADPGEIQEPALDPRQVLDTVQMSRKEHAGALALQYMKVPSKENYDALLAYKKQAKVSWEKLGIPEPAPFDPLALVGATNPLDPAEALPPAAPVKRAPKGKKPVKKAPKKASGKPQVKRKPAKAPKTPAKAPKSTSKPAEAKVVNQVQTGLGSYRERIQKLIPVTSVGGAQAVLLLKRQSKKSWAVLGVSADEEQRILNLAHPEK